MNVGRLKAEPKTEWKDTELDDVRVLVTGLKTIAFRRRLEALMGQTAVAKQIKQGGKREADARDACFNRALSDTVLQGWENVTEDDGTQIIYDHDFALALLTESLPFRDAVVTAASEIDTARYVKEEDLVGNSLST